MATGVEVVYRKSDNAIYRRRRTSGGVWQSEETIATPRSGAQLDQPVKVRGSRWFAFAETDDDETVEGAFPMFMHDGIRVLQDGELRGTLSSLFSGGVAQPSSAEIAAYSAFLDTALTDGWWQNLQSFYLLYGNGGAHLRNWKYGNFDLTEAGTGTGFASGGFWSSNGTDRYLDTGMSLSQFLVPTDANIGMACSGPAGVAMRIGNVGGTNFHGCILSATNGAGTATVFGLNTTNAHAPANTSNTGVFEGFRESASLQVYLDGTALAVPEARTDAAASNVNLVIGRASSTPIFAESTQTCHAVWAGTGTGAGAARDAVASSRAAAVAALVNALAPGTL